MNNSLFIYVCMYINIVLIYIYIFIVYDKG